MNRRFLPVFGLVLCLPAILISALPAPQSTVPTPLEECTKRTASLKVGMTRGDVTKIMIHEGGLHVIFDSEPFALADNGKLVDFIVAEEKYPVACMRTLDFRPQGMSDKTYSDPELYGKWSSEHPDSISGSLTDIIVKISSPFLAPFFTG